MDLELIDPELRPALKKLPHLDTSNRLVRLLGRVGPRLRRTARVPGVDIRWLRTDGLRLRVYTPTRSAESPQPRASLLWIHGGGLVIGTAQQDDWLCATTAANLNVIVVSVEYRLAPEHPFPAAIDDAVAAWDWIQRNADSLGMDPARVAIGGESAGGGIAASLAQRLHDTSDVQPAAQWLFAPMLDDRTSLRTDLDAIDHPVWNNVANRFGWRSYLGLLASREHVPDYAVAARRADLTGLPPTWVCVGDVELFHDEISVYAQRLHTAGNDVTLEIIPGGAHGFENWASTTQLAQRLVGRAHEWIASRLR